MDPKCMHTGFKEMFVGLNLYTREYQKDFWVIRHRLMFVPGNYHIQNRSKCIASKPHQILVNLGTPSLFVVFVFSLYILVPETWLVGRLMCVFGNVLYAGTGTPKWMHIWSK